MHRGSRRVGGRKEGWGDEVPGWREKSTSRVGGTRDSGGALAWVCRWIWRGGSKLGRVGRRAWVG